MSVSIATSTNVFIIGSSIVVPVDLQSSEIAYDSTNNAFIVEGTVTTFGTVVIGNTVNVNLASSGIAYDSTNNAFYVELKTSDIAYDSTNNAFIVEGTVEIGNPVAVSNTVPVTLTSSSIGYNSAANAFIVQGTVQISNNLSELQAQVSIQQVLLSQVFFATVLPQTSLLATPVIASITGSAEIFLTSGQAVPIALQIVPAGSTITVTSLLNDGNALNANTWYDFKVPVLQGDGINVFNPTTGTVVISARIFNVAE
ncbi:MAG: hypothetical protein QW320_10050 [Ignisphaera sp.]